MTSSFAQNQLRARAAPAQQALQTHEVTLPALLPDRWIRGNADAKALEALLDALLYGCAVFIVVGLVLTIF